MLPVMYRLPPINGYISTSFGSESSTKQQHRSDYTTGCWEGLSVELMLDKDNNPVGINVILHRPRLERMSRSIMSRGYSSEISIEKFGSIILDLVAIHGFYMLILNSRTCGHYA